MTEEQTKRYLELLASPAGTARLVIELEQKLKLAEEKIAKACAGHRDTKAKLAAVEGVATGRLNELNRLAGEKIELWKRAEQAEAQVEVLKQELEMRKDFETGYKVLEEENAELRARLNAVGLQPHQ